MTRAAIYIRISQDSTGKRAGVERQLKDCRALAKRMKLTVAGEPFDDNDTSAFNGAERPGFERLLAEIKAGHVDTIICWHPDRLYRRVKDLQRLVDLADQGVKIVSVNGGEVDLSTATGKMLARILGSVAEMESEHKGERRRTANKERTLSGSWRADGPRVFGYTQGGKGEPGQPIQAEAQAVQKAARDVLAGTSLRAIAAEWNAAGLRTPKASTGKGKGGTKWSNLQLNRLLRRPVYAGLRAYTDDHGHPQTSTGDWVALFDRDTHLALVQLLTDPARRPASRFLRLHQGSSVYRCGICGEPLYAVTHHTGRLLYGCKPTKHLTRQAEPIDEFITAITLGVLTQSDLGQKLAQRTGVDTAELRAKRSGLEKRKKGLAALYAEGILDADAVRDQALMLTKSIEEITGQLSRAAQTSTAARLLVDGPAEVKRHWDEASPDIRGKVIAELMTVTVLPAPGRQGILVDRETGARTVNPDYIRVEPKL
jgi:DNA invertase Pin-like site-specific DNA recombinase